MHSGINNMDEEKEFLLDAEEERETRTPGGKSRSYFRFYLLFLHLILAISLAGNMYSTTRLRSRDETFTIFPGLRHLRHITKKEHATNHTAYTNFSGPPNEVNAAAWNHLLQPLYFNASAKELVSAGASPSKSVKVKEGGYIASLGVYHEIHCLNKLRYFLYSPNLLETETDIWTEHLDHCIEVLRLSATCRADLSVYTFSWPANNTNAAFLDAHSNSARQCVDWEQLEAYSWKRKISLAPTLLKNVDDDSDWLGKY